MERATLVRILTLPALRYGSDFVTTRAMDARVTIARFPALNVIMIEVRARILSNVSAYRSLTDYHALAGVFTHAYWKACKLDGKATKGI